MTRRRYRAWEAFSRSAWLDGTEHLGHSEFTVLAKLTLAADHDEDLGFVQGSDRYLADLVGIKRLRTYQEVRDRLVTKGELRRPDTRAVNQHQLTGIWVVRYDELTARRPLRGDSLSESPHPAAHEASPEGSTGADSVGDSVGESVADSLSESAEQGKRSLHRTQNTEHKSEQASPRKTGATPAPLSEKQWLEIIEDELLVNDVLDSSLAGEVSITAVTNWALLARKSVPEITGTQLRDAMSHLVGRWVKGALRPNPQIVLEVISEFSGY